MPGFFLIEIEQGNYCKPCTADLCETCPDDQCTQCTSGFSVEVTEKGSVCSPTPPPKTSIVLVVVVVVAALLVIAGGAFFVWKYLKAKNAKECDPDPGITL